MSNIPRNPFEHHHDHDHGHDHDHDHAHDHPEGAHVEDLDPAQQSLADALRVSFTVLKVAMVILLVVYLFSGFFNVKSGEVAVRLRFGRIVTPEPLNAGGPHFAFPYPIEQVIRIPTAQQQAALKNEFMYENPQNRSLQELEASAAQQPLNPEKAGSLLTGDANIMHARFNLYYRVDTDDKTKVEDYVTNVGTLERANEIVRRAAEQAVVFAAAQVTSDEVMQGHFKRQVARDHMNETLQRLRTGITVDRLEVDDQTVPLSVRAAYQAVTAAEQERARAIVAAQQDRDRILAEAAGTGTRALVETINRYEVAAAAGDQSTIALLDERLDWMYANLRAPLWVTAELSPEAEASAWQLLRTSVGSEDQAEAQAAGTRLEALLAEHEVPPALRMTQAITGEAATVISKAIEFRDTQRTIVEADVERFRQYYAQYQGNPELRGIIMARLWQQTKQDILGGDVETIYLPPGQVYPVINRDPAVARERERAGLQRGTEAQRRAAAGNVTTPTNPTPPRPPAPPPGGGGGGDQH